MMIAHSNEVDPVGSDAKVLVNGPRLVTATPDEQRKERYSSENVKKALEAMHQDGFVVLKSVVNTAHVRLLREHMATEADELVRNKTKPFNQGVMSNMLQGPPVTKPELLFNDVFFNPFVIQIMTAYLGFKPSWGFMTGNTALPNTHGPRQPVHKDIVFYHPQCPFYAIANLPLSKFSKENGSTEFWLGSHAHTSGEDQIIAKPDDKLENGKLRLGEPLCNVRAEVFEKRRKTRPPVQPEAEPGDFMIRDLRTWHAGMPNETAEFRTMLALGYQAP